MVQPGIRDVATGAASISPLVPGGNPGALPGGQPPLPWHQGSGARRVTGAGTPLSHAAEARTPADLGHTRRSSTPRPQAGSRSAAAPKPSAAKACISSMVLAIPNRIRPPHRHKPHRDHPMASRPRCSRPP